MIDDVTRLKLHREADQDVLDLIRELMSLPATLVLVGVGIPKSGAAPGQQAHRPGGSPARSDFPPVPDHGKSRNDDAPGQTDLRFDLVDLDRFSYASRTAPPPGPPTSSASSSSSASSATATACSAAAACPSTCSAAPRLVGLLEELIQAVRQAIETGTETITAGLLDALTVSPADLPGLDPDAGEVHGMPPAPTRPGDGASRGTLSSSVGHPRDGTAG